MGVSIAERIRRWREWSGLSLTELANRVGVSRNAATYWELPDDEPNASEPTHANVQRIADAFGLTLAMFWSEPPKGRRAAS